MLETHPKKYHHDSDSATQITDLRGRSHRGPGSTRFRCYVAIHAVSVSDHPAIFPIALRRSAKVRGIIQSYYPIGSTSIDLRSWATEACDLFDEILPALDPPKFPTHFLLVGVTINGKDEPFFKVFLSISNGLRSPDDCARHMGYFLFHYFESHVCLAPDDLLKPQTWVLNCLLAQWRLLRRI